MKRVVEGPSEGSFGHYLLNTPFQEMGHVI